MAAADLEALDRLRDAINSHDPARVASCFTEDFHSEVPHHPERSFTGAHHVVANWTAIFAMAPNLTAGILRSAVNGIEAWSEWEMVGNRADGSAVVMAGPAITTTRGGKIASARFYLDVVDAPPR